MRADEAAATPLALLLSQPTRPARCGLLGSTWTQPRRVIPSECHSSLAGPGAGGLVTGRASGLLNGLNGTELGDAATAKHGFKVWRGPNAMWLWPNRSRCTGHGSCCTAESCAPPFAEARRLSGLGLAQKYIVEAVHTGVGDCEWRSLHGAPLHNCSLPGGPADPGMARWAETVRWTALGAARAGIARPMFDIWNEPNGMRNVGCTGDPGCVYDGNLTQQASHALYDVAHRTLRDTLPEGRIVAPSLAGGGPGIAGWSSVFLWLRRFLAHAHGAGTLPDVLTWHTGNWSGLEAQHGELAAWAAGAGIPLPPIGHNEIIGPRDTLEPAPNLAFLAALERLRVHHACRACWTDGVTRQSPCFDNSLDGLLTDGCVEPSPLRPGCEALRPRSNARVYAWYAALEGATMWSLSTPRGLAAGNRSAVTVLIAPAAAAPCEAVLALPPGMGAGTLQRLPPSGRAAAAEPPLEPLAVQGDGRVRWAAAPGHVYRVVLQRL